MPIYEYHCTNCGEEVDKLQDVGSLLPSCTICSGEMGRKPPSNIMVKMKGEGGYPSRHKQVFNTTMRKHPELT